MEGEQKKIKMGGCASLPLRHATFSFSFCIDSLRVEQRGPTHHTVFDTPGMAARHGSSANFSPCPAHETHLTQNLFKLLQLFLACAEIS